MDAAAITAIGGIFIGISTLFLKFIRDNQKSQERREAAQEKRDKAFVASLKKNTKAMNQVAEATSQSAKEAKERNGHLAELQLNSQAMIDRNYGAVDDAVKKVISHITNQEVKTQHVGKQIIDKK